MDFSLISGAVGTLGTAVEIARATVGLRDAGKLSTAVAEITDKLLQAQQQLFVVQSQAFALQHELAEAKEESRVLKTRSEERSKYALFEVAQGNFVYRSKVDSACSGSPLEAEPTHYLCQPCFDSGTKVVLGMRGGGNWVRQVHCPVCKRGIAVS